jgi:hypothetical protein
MLINALEILFQLVFITLNHDLINVSINKTS